MISVLAHSSIQIMLGKRTKFYNESHGQISFNLSNSAFKTLLAKVKDSGLNPYAVMYWEEI